MEKRPLQPKESGLWRFGVISPLLHCREAGGLLRPEILRLSKKSFLRPDGREVQLSPDTLSNWYYRYKSYGLDALNNKNRRDQGTTSVPLALQDMLTQYRKDHPNWTLQRILNNLQDQDLWDGRKPSRSAVYRYAKTHELYRNPVNPPESVRSFEYAHFGDLWSADFLHGPKVRVGVKYQKCYLHAIIDDASRYIVAARFHLAQNIQSLYDDLFLAIRRFGIPLRFYTDNGAAFRSHYLRVVAGRLGIALPHTPAYKPKGRGKIERVFRTIRDQFLTGREKSSLKKLNEDFALWLNQYHNKIHSSLQMSPLNKKLAVQKQPLKQLPSTDKVDDLFRMEAEKKVGSDGCIRMFNKRFEIPDALPKSKTIIYYLPWEQDHILVGENKTVARVVDTNKNATRFDKPLRKNNNQKGDDLS